jgi:acetyl-CoA carboxylase, biotin carboxylase subunit
VFRRILIANRGEVAHRILQTCHRLGVEVVAVTSTADRDQAWLVEADHVVCIGGAPARSSYLNQEAIFEVARRCRASAIHPGWGFLAENAQFAQRCESLGLTFIGPSAKHILEMGDKSLARKTMATLGMPVIPGTKDPLKDLDQARRVADELGYPVLIKAVAGGGGRGMRAASDESALKQAFVEAGAEATAAFGDGRLYLEKQIVGGRHVEVQVVADHFGACATVGERECSLQRRHQKVLEEAPSPGLSVAERERILPVVAEAVRRSGYRNVGTVEMLLDADGALWFMEMNTRLQVEHAVSEAVTGVDLVECQLRIAANEPLGALLADKPVRGHAIECRINAEDPDAGFRPSPGLVTRLKWPEGEGVRVDTHLSTGDRISPHYDSMIGKVIVSAPDRAQCLVRLEAALQHTVVEGVKTNIGLHKRILQWEAFRNGRYDTTSLERELMGQ